MAAARDQAGGPGRAKADAPAAHAGRTEVEVVNDAPTTESPATVQRLLALQRQAGNHAVSELVRRGVVQRVLVDASTSETLYNTEAASGQATPTQYSVSGNYDLTRQADTGVTVKVKIRFVSQSRNTVPPTPPATTPRVGQLTGPQTEIPAGDTRRQWAEDTMRGAIGHWNGHLTFVGVETPAVGPPGAGAGAGAPQAPAPAPGAAPAPTGPVTKRLPVTFVAEPVWTLGGDANATVVIHPATVVGGSTGNPIDAGNFYESRNQQIYPANDDVIYAHEYGHLLGIPDEYSQSNRQMHLLLHQSSPTGAASAGAALDRATVEHMVLAAMRRPLYFQLDNSLPAVVSAFRATQPAITERLSTSLRTSIREQSVADALRTQLELASAQRLHGSVPAIAAFETTTNFSPRSRAIEAVTSQLAGPALTSRIQNAYWAALGAGSNIVNVAGLGDVSINMSSSMSTIGEGTGAAAPQASALANATVGAQTSPGARIPQIAPPESLVGQLRALPGTWTQAGSVLQSAITPEIMSSRMASTLQAANIATTLQDLVPGAAARPRIQQVGMLYRKALEIVTNLASGVARDLVSELLDSQITPALQMSVTSFQTAVHNEVDRVMNTPAGALAAAAPPDPAMVAMVAAMKSRLDAAKAATAASTSRDPLGAGQAAPDQDVTYSYQGLMGTNSTTALRTDQFAPMLRAFNTNHKQPTESDFTAESR